MRPISAHRSTAHASVADLEAGIDFVRESPAEAGTLELIVGRPVENQRELVEEGRLDQAVGLVGDSWAVRPSSSTADGGPNPEAQVTVMNARAAALVARGSHPLRWAQAGDQLYVDFDLSQHNLPPRARLRIGEAVLEVTADPHLGCGKFGRRFGIEALKFVNSPAGRALRLRGLNARVFEPGIIRRSDEVRKL